MAKAAEPRIVAQPRCAVYTRKSSEEGVDQAFNALDAQREACEAYIASQRHAGWSLVPDAYEDSGFSGGTLQRPALKRLMADIVAGKIQIVVVYKVDRLTRSLADFAKIVDILDAHGASFVSVTQQFNTTTSMGRLTLNVLLSFAQFEREIAGERIRDKIAASKKKGMWMGGTIPLGYDVVERRLVVNATEADEVRTIFRRYAALGSVALLRMELTRAGLVSKRRVSPDPRLAGGKPYSRGALYLMLQNPIYRGLIAHQRETFPAQHEAIVDAELWQTVQHILATHRQERALGTTAEAPSLLAGRIFDADGTRLTPTHAVKRGKRYRYYVSTALITGNRSAHPRGRRLPAGDVEGLVRDRLRAFFAAPDAIAEALAPLELSAPVLRAALAAAHTLADRWLSAPPRATHKLVQSILTRVTIEDDRIGLQLDRQAVFVCLIGEGTRAPNATPSQPAPIILVIEARLRRAGKGLRLVIGAGAAPTIDRGLTTLLGRAVAARLAVLSAEDASLAALAQRLGMKRDQLTGLVRVSTLAPGIVEAILEGRQPLGLSARQLMRMSHALPLDWTAQRKFLGFAAV